MNVTIKIEKESKTGYVDYVELSISELKDLMNQLNEVADIILGDDEIGEIEKIDFNPFATLYSRAMLDRETFKNRVENDEKQESK